MTMRQQCNRRFPGKRDEIGQALAEYLLAIPPILLAALGLAYLFREAWDSLFSRLLILLGPWP